MKDADLMIFSVLCCFLEHEMASLIVVAVWAMAFVYSIYPTTLGMNGFPVWKVHTASS